MKTTTLALFGLLLISCKKDETTGPASIQPVTRHLFATFPASDSGSMDVVIDRATQTGVESSWNTVSDSTFTLATPTGQYQMNVYRNDVVKFISTATVARDVVVRVDDIQTFTVHVDPASNGQIVHEVTLNW